MDSQLEGEDWGRVYYLLHHRCGYNYWEIEKLPQFYLMVMYDEAVYDELLEMYHKSTSF